MGPPTHWCESVQCLHIVNGRHRQTEVWPTPVRLLAGREKNEETKKGESEEQCTARQTEIHGYSNFGVLSQSYWKTVHSELSTEIRY